jgi:hypothetical protein
MTSDLSHEPEPNRGYDGSLMDGRESDHGYGTLEERYAANLHGVLSIE